MADLIFQSQLINNGNFDQWYTYNSPGWKPRHWHGEHIEASGGYYISGVYEDDDEVYRDNYSLRLGISGEESWTEWMYSDAIELSNISGEVLYEWSTRILNDGAGQIIINLNEYDSDFELLTTNSLVNDNANLPAWTRFSKTIGGLNAGGDITLQVATEFVRIRMRAYTLSTRNYWIDDMRLCGINSVIVLHRGIITPIEPTHTRYGMKEISVGGTIYSKDYQIESLRFDANFQGLSRSTFDELIAFFNHSDIQYGHHKFLYIDSNGTPFDVKMIPQSLEFIEVVANLFNISFTLLDEGRNWPYG